VVTFSDRKFADVMINAIARVAVRAMLNNVNQRYSSILPALRVVACDCFAKQSNCFGQLTSLAATDATCSADPTTTSVCSGTNGQVTLTPSNFPPNSPPADINTQTFSAGGAAAGSTPSSGAAPASLTPRFMTLAEKILAVGNSATFAVVPNANGAIVGQLVGNGYTVSASVNLVYPLSVCISQSASIDQDTTSYPTYDFAIQKVDGTVGLPQDLTVTVSGLQLCANVPAAGTYYPILRVNNWASVQPPNNGGGTSSSTGSIVTGVAAQFTPSMLFMVVALFASLFLF
jgi:hypothetical protein